MREAWKSEEEKENYCRRHFKEQDSYERLQATVILSDNLGMIVRALHDLKSFSLISENRLKKGYDQTIP